MDTDREALLDWIEAEKPAFVAILRDFIRAKSPNPPGDTREAAAHVIRFLEESSLAYCVIAPQPVTRTPLQISRVEIPEGISCSMAISMSSEAGREAMDTAMGEGASEIMSRVTLNIGRVEGGLKVNMIPGQCRFEADIRLPVGVTKERMLSAVAWLLEHYPEATMREIGSTEPSWCDHNGEMVEIIQQNVEHLRGFRPVPTISLGGTDARLWRHANVPAYVYGPFPRGMGSQDEHVEIEEFLHILRTHVLSAYDYLTREREHNST